MQNEYFKDLIDQLFDDAKDSLKKDNLLEIIEKKKNLREEKECWMNVNTFLLGDAILSLIKEVLMNIQLTKKTNGIIDPKDFKKYYEYGELRNVKKIEKPDDTDILSIFKDKVFEYNSEFNYDTLNYYKMTNDELSMTLNFSNTYIDNKLYDGGYLEYDDINIELLNDYLSKYGVSAKLYTSFGNMTGGNQIISTIVIDIHYYRNYEKEKIK